MVKRRVIVPVPKFVVEPAVGHFLVMGDAHLRVQPPRSRCDDFFFTQLGKFKQVLALAKEHECYFILQPGDLFDRPQPSNYLMSVYIKLLKEQALLALFCVLGQHDISMHNVRTFERSAAKVFEVSQAIQLLGKEPTSLLIADGSIYLYGTHYGGDVPVPTSEEFNILVIHAPIGDRPLYPGDPMISPRRFLIEHPEFDIVVCGDYHYAFADEYEGRLIVNAGCLVRKTAAQRDQELQPSVVLVTLESNQGVVSLRGWERLLLNYEPVAEVFRADALNGSKRMETGDLTSLVARLQEGSMVGASFKENLIHFFDQNTTSQSVQEVVWGIMEEVGL